MCVAWRPRHPWGSWSCLHPSPTPISPPGLHDVLQPRDEGGGRSPRVIPLMAQDVVQQLAWLMLL